MDPSHPTRTTKLFSMEVLKTLLRQKGHMMNDTDIVREAIALYHANKTVNYTDTTIPTPTEDTPSDFYCGGKLERIVVAYGNNYHVYLSIFICLFGTIANVFNIAVLTRKDMACAPINRILTGLAVADMLLMIEYIPFAYYYHLQLLQGDREFPYIGAVCMLLHNHITQILHTISICLTLTLAIWRYLAIRYPNRNHILCSDRRCTIAISLSYFLPFFLCIPSYFTIKITEEIVEEEGTNYTLYHTTLTDLLKDNILILQSNFWFYAVFIKLLPCFLLTIISYSLIRTLLTAKRRKQILRNYQSYLLADSGPNANHTPKITKAERRADRTTKMLIAVVLLFVLTEFPQGILAFCIGIKGSALFLGCYQKYGTFMDILALINGAINFILYCCMNRMFRVNFGLLFKHRILGRMAVINISDHTTTPNITNTTEM